MAKRKGGKGRPAPEKEAERTNPPAAGPIQQVEEVLGRRSFRLGVPIAIFLLSLGVSIFAFDEKLSLTGDNTEFIILARAVAQGEGMSLINYPTPKVSTKYPFGLPVMLAPLAMLFDADAAPGAMPDWVMMKWLVVFMFCAAMVVLYHLVADQWGRVPALAVTGLSLTNPLVVDYGHQVMSEVPFLLFSLLALFCLELSMKQATIAGNYWLISGFAFMMWAYYVRSMGIVLVGAAIISVAQRRQFRKALAIAVGAVVVALPWTLRNRAVGSGAVYLKQLILQNPYYPDRGIVTLADYIERISYNLLTYIVREIPAALWPHSQQTIPIIQWNPDGVEILSPQALVVIALAAYTMVLCVSRGYHLLLLNYLILSIGILIVWPWPSDRFLVPVVPLMILFTLRVVADLARRVGTRLGQGTSSGVNAVAMMGLLVMNGMGLDRVAALAQQTYPEFFRDYYAAGQWIKEHSSRNAVVCGRKPFWMYVVSGRKCVPYVFKDPPEVLASLEENGVDFVVVGQLSMTTFKHLVPTIQRFPERFDLLLQLQETATYVFGFRRRAQP